jgi:uncharacterized membrane protein
MILRILRLGCGFLRQHQALAAASILGLALIVARSGMSGRGAYLFYVWNLFLAWLPLIFATMALHFAARGRTTPAAVFGLLWLLFFPNAPYLVTDLIHWQPRAPVSRSSVWYDLLLGVHFAWLGLALGFASLRQLEHAISGRYGSWIGTLFSTVSLGLASYGVYLGRFGRWNSWDFFTQPVQLLEVLARDLFHPRSHVRTWEFTLICGLVLICAYWSGLAPATAKANREPAKTF